MSAVAVYYGVRSLLQDPAGDVRMNEDDALRCSVRHGHVEHVRELLRRGADPNACGAAPLAEATQKGSTAVVRALLDHGADPSLNEGLAWGTAVMWERSDLLGLLHRHSRHPPPHRARAITEENACGGSQKLVLLLPMAVEKSRPDILRELLRCGSGVELIREENIVGIMGLARYKRIEEDVASVLVETGGVGTERLEQLREDIAHMSVCISDNRLREAERQIFGTAITGRACGCAD